MQFSVLGFDYNGEDNLITVATSLLGEFNQLIKSVQVCESIELIYLRRIQFQLPLFVFFQDV